MRENLNLPGRLMLGPTGLPESLIRDKAWVISMQNHRLVYTLVPKPLIDADIDALTAPDRIDSTLIAAVAEVLVVTTRPSTPRPQPKS